MSTIEAIHNHLLQLGYWDTRLFNDLGGFPSSGVLPLSGLWPLAADGPDKVQAMQSVNENCKMAWSRCENRLRNAKPAVRVKAMIDKYGAAVSRGRCRQRSERQVRNRKHGLLHPAFVLEQGKRLREIVDETAGCLNPCAV